MIGFSDREIARVCHEANRAIQKIIGDDHPSPAWDVSPTDQIESAVIGVGVARGGATPEELHESWRAEKLLAGWVYGEKKDGIAKTHPCLVDYSELPAEQRIKDRLFGAIVAALGEGEAL